MSDEAKLLKRIETLEKQVKELAAAVLKVAEELRIALPHVSFEGDDGR